MIATDTPIYVNNTTIKNVESYINKASWWTTAAIQRCSQATPKGYIHNRRPAGRPLHKINNSWRQAIHKGKSHIEENISQKCQHDHNLRRSFPDASAPVIFCVNCGGGFKSQIGPFSHQRPKHVTDETLNRCHHRTRCTAQKKKKEDGVDFLQEFDVHIFYPLFFKRGRCCLSLH